MSTTVDGPRLYAWLCENGLENVETQLGFHARAARHWRDGGGAGLSTIDAVLTKLDLHLDLLPDDLRPEAEETLPPPREKRRRPSNAKLTDSQIRALHMLHIKGGMSISELARRTWKQAGFKNPAAAITGIRVGFRRLYLPIEKRHPSTLPHLPRCEFVKQDGCRCGAYPLEGEQFCFPHHPDNRERARLSAARARQVRYAEAAA